MDPGLRKKPPDLPGGLAGLGRKAGGATPHPHFPAVVEPVFLDAADIEPGLSERALDDDVGWRAAVLKEPLSRPCHAILLAGGTGGRGVQSGVRQLHRTEWQNGAAQDGITAPPLM